MLKNTLTLTASLKMGLELGASVTDEHRGAEEADPSSQALHAPRLPVMIGSLCSTW